MSKGAGISTGSCHAIVTENLSMKLVAANFVRPVLTNE